MYDLIVSRFRKIFPLICTVQTKISRLGRQRGGDQDNDMNQMTKDKKLNTTNSLDE